ncbi:hypothetical protein HY479_03260 [Candidatus Uhrbacteria bacterium]|nr:hypothetical protein [Candidatus Uhrbacteria bacterium]
MSFWPIIISIAFLIVAYVAFFMLPEISEHGNSFLWAAAGVVVLFLGAAAYLNSTVPRVSEFSSQRATLTRVEAFIQENLFPRRY